MPGSGASRAAALAAAWSGIAGAQKLDAAKTPGYEAELEINDFPQHARWKVGGWEKSGDKHSSLEPETAGESPCVHRW